MRYFIDQGFSPYFDCTNKGCNVFDVRTPRSVLPAPV